MFCGFPCTKVPFDKIVSNNSVQPSHLDQVKHMFFIEWNEIILSWKIYFFWFDKVQTTATQLSLSIEQSTLL